MNILHYALGFPPYRTGGLTKYAVDLMIGQKDIGHEVGMLWPGQIGFINHRTSICKRKNIAVIYEQPVKALFSYEIINPLPVSFDEGIADVPAYTAKVDKEVFVKFLMKIKPDVVHIHTLMGLHKEFIEAANDLNIRTLLTTHDFFGICPTVTMFYQGHTCDDNNFYAHCVECNKSALSLKKIALLQSPIYRVLKDSVLVSKIRRNHRRKFFDDIFKNKDLFLSEKFVEKESEKYKCLQKYYANMYLMIDIIHYNSSISKMIYSKYMDLKISKILNISHRDIKDHRKKKIFSGKLKISYLGSAKPFKGFDLLKDALDWIYENDNKDFEVNVYSLTNKVSPYMNIQDGYNYRDLESIFDKTDLLVAPSICYETFGFTVLEAISYGVPVLVSESVGSKDLIVSDQNGIIFHNLIESLLDIFHRKEQLANINENINKMKYSFDFADHCKKIEELYE